MEFAVNTNFVLPREKLRLVCTKIEVVGSGTKFDFEVCLTFAYVMDEIKGKITRGFFDLEIFSLR